jgi:hypothetical protein
MTASTPLQKAVLLMAETGLDYLGINIRDLPWDSSVVISRYATLGCTVPAEELMNKPIPPEFVAQIHALFPGRKIVTKETITTEEDLIAERRLFEQLQGEG